MVVALLVGWNSDMMLNCSDAMLISNVVIREAAMVWKYAGQRRINKVGKAGDVVQIYEKIRSTITQSPTGSVYPYSAIIASSHPSITHIRGRESEQESRHAFTVLPECPSGKRSRVDRSEKSPHSLTFAGGEISEQSLHVRRIHHASHCIAHRRRWDRRDKCESIL